MTDLPPTVTVTTEPVRVMMASNADRYVILGNLAIGSQFVWASTLWQWIDMHDGMRNAVREVGTGRISWITPDTIVLRA